MILKSTTLHMSLHKILSAKGFQLMLAAQEMKLPNDHISMKLKYTIYLEVTLSLLSLEHIYQRLKRKKRDS